MASEVLSQCKAPPLAAIPSRSFGTSCVHLHEYVTHVGHLCLSVRRGGLNWLKENSNQSSLGSSVLGACLGLLQLMGKVHPYPRSEGEKQSSSNMTISMVFGSRFGWLGITLLGLHKDPLHICWPCLRQYDWGNMGPKE